MTRLADLAPRTGRGPAICPTDDDAITPKPAASVSKTDKQSWEYIVKSGVAGGVAGCAAKTVVGPLDRVKILFQASNPQFAKYTGSWFGLTHAMRDIYSHNGMRGLFKGHSATLLRIFPYAGIKFLAYEQIRARIIHSPAQETPVRRFVSGSLAGTVSVFCTYPLEVIRVRLAFETQESGAARSTLSSICRKIYNERPPPPAAASASASAVGKPLASAAATVHTITPRAGLANFFRGFTPTLWGMLPYAGSSFLTHDSLSDLLRHPRIAAYTTIPSPTNPHNTTSHASTHKPAPLKYWAELSAGGLAGFVSQTVSYPLEVVRRRMQVGGVVGDGHRLGMLEVASRIWLERGWRGFFVGLAIGYVKVIPLAATSFYVYERGKYVLGI